MESYFSNETWTTFKQPDLTHVPKSVCTPG